MTVIGNSPDGQRLAQLLKASYSELYQKTYPDSETSLTLMKKISGTEVLVYLQFALTENLDQQIFSLLSLMRYAAQAKQKVKLILPYLPYTRSLPLGSDLEISKFEAMLATLAQYTHDLYVLEPHCWTSEIAERFPGGKVHEIQSERSLVAFLKKELKDFVLTGPDEGSADMVRGLSELSGKPYVVLEKKRLTPEKVESHGVHNSIDTKLLNKHFVIVDDISSTGGTLLATVDRLREYGVKKISCFVFHNLIRDEKVLRELAKREAKLYYANSLPREGYSVDIIPDVAQALDAANDRASHTRARAKVR